MSVINNIGPNDPIQQIANNPIQRNLPAGANPDAPPTSPADQLELSGSSHLLQALQQNNIRADKVSSIRAQIEAGTYETDDKLNGALDKLLDDLNK